MHNAHYTLVLSGEVLPGFRPEVVWPAMAAQFHTDIDSFRKRLLARAPIIIKQLDDLGKLQTLQAAANGIGAEVEICAPDARPGVFVLLDHVARGPMPRVYVEEHVARGLWPHLLTIAEVGSENWQLHRFGEPRPSTGETSASALVEPRPDDDAPKSDALAAPITVPPRIAENALSIVPSGASIHAGFWRRCAAYLLDSIVLAVVGWVVFAVSAAPFRSAGDFVAIGIGMFTNTLVMMVIGWLYFALQESSTAQATLGKRALAIKVADDAGNRIGLGRASGRYFAKGVSAILFDVGFMMAGWTARKQALHDMMAGTVVVFRDVLPGRRWPDARPPMPWYGWLVNIVFIALCALGVIGAVLYGSEMVHLAASGALPSDGGF